MKGRSLGVSVIATFLAVAFIGAAFIRLGIQHRGAESRLATTETVDRIAAALERETQAIGEALLRGDIDAVRDLKPVEMVIVARDGQVALRHPPTAMSVDPADWIEAGGKGLTWIGPLRGAGGEPKLVARQPVDTEGTPSIVAAVVDVHRLLEAAGLTQLARRGFDFRLSSAGSRAAVLAASTPSQLERVVVRQLTPGKGTWSLAIAPSESRTPWPPILLHGLIVLALAAAAALAVHERAHTRASLQSDLAQRTEKLRNTTQRLADEVQQRETLEKQFSHASYHDALTGLPNRRFLVNRLESALQRTRTGVGVAPAVAIVELARTKAIGDSFGMVVAEEVVTQAARRLETLLEGTDLVLGRLRDTGFACLISNPESRDEVMKAVTRLQQSLLQPFSVAGHTLYVSSHAGIAFSTSGYDHPEDLVRGAHVALSRAKLEHMAVVVFDPSTQEQVISRHQLETDLHGVAERGELRVHYQPIVALASGELAGFEALVRWQHPREGMIPPGIFIHLAEETGLISPITRWVLREAVNQARAWREELRADKTFYVSVNLSAHDMRQPDLADYVEEILRESGLPAGTLRLEVTEGSMIDNVRQAVELITRFRELGAKILLDDFGTGYSSLSYLHRFPIDYLKIDQSFVRRMSPDPASSGIVRAILYLAEGMGIKTVAEGIETEEIMGLLLELNCAYGQGYLFSKPVEAAAARKLLLAPPTWCLPPRLPLKLATAGDA